jgi:hypothetical protein
LKIGRNRRLRVQRSMNPPYIPTSPSTGYVWSTRYIWARGQTYLVKTDLDLAGRNGPDMSGKEVDMSGQFRTELIWKTLEIR